MVGEQITSHMSTMWRQPPKLGLMFFELSVTCWSKGGDNLLIKKLELRFLKSVSLSDQKAETNIHPKHWILDFWELCMYSRFLTAILLFPNLMVSREHLILTWGGDSPHPKLWPRFFGLSVTCWSKGGDNLPHPKSWDLGFWSQSHLLIKRWRHLKAVEGVLCQGGDTTTSKVGTWVFEVSVTCWSKGRDNPHP